MNTRCSNANHSAYSHYGARGITVYPQWRTSFEDFEFYVTQLPHCEDRGYTLDRIDNNGNYEPGNLRWATQSEQLSNTRRTHLITYNGKTQCVAAWCKEFGMSHATVSRRLSAGWSAEMALTTPGRRQDGLVAA
jgi:hypothetical protein